MASAVKADKGAAQKTPVLKVKHKALLGAVKRALGEIVLIEGQAQGKYAKAASAVNAFALAEYGQDTAPWFLFVYEKLPDALRKEYEVFTGNLKAVDHSNPAGMWARVRDLAAKEAQADGSWSKFKERVNEQAAKRDKMLEANREHKRKAAEAAKTPAPAPATAPASAPRVITSGKPTAEQAATAPKAEQPETTQAEVIAKLPKQEQALAAFAIGVRQAVQAINDCPDLDPVLVATAKAVATAFQAVAPKVADLEKKINRLRTGGSK
jgi:hypothetical protein